MEPVDWLFELLPFAIVALTSWFVGTIFGYYTACKDEENRAARQKEMQ